MRFGRLRGGALASRPNLAPGHIYNVNAISHSYSTTPEKCPRLTNEKGMCCSCMFSLLPTPVNPFFTGRQNNSRLDELASKVSSLRDVTINIYDNARDQHIIDDSVCDTVFSILQQCQDY